MSWWQLLEARQAARELRREELGRPPDACPNDGTPLLPAPPGTGPSWSARTTAGSTPGTTTVPLSNNFINPQVSP